MVLCGGGVGNSCPWGTFGNACRHVWLSQQGCLVGRDQECCSASYKDRTPPQQRERAAQRSTVSMLRNSTPGVTVYDLTVEGVLAKWAYCPITFWSIICWWVELKWTHLKSTSSAHPLTPPRQPLRVPFNPTDLKAHCAQNLRFGIGVKRWSTFLSLSLKTKKKTSS